MHVMSVRFIKNLHVKVYLTKLPQYLKEKHELVTISNHFQFMFW